MPRVRPIDWKPLHPGHLSPGLVRLLDQTRLPETVAWIETAEPEAIWDAIKTLKVRGAPAIGVCAAMGVAAAAGYALARPPGPAAHGQCHADQQDATEAMRASVMEAAAYLATARPTAVNLFWALDRMRRVASEPAHSPEALAERLAAEALAIRDEDIAMCRAIGKHGLNLLRSGATVLTHCNAGGLATSEYGTALAPVYAAHERGMPIRVFADETRPLLQGARLTAWELMQAGIPVTLICDNMAAQVMKEGRIDAVLVGADRIAANGDAANKIGTYGVALLARAHTIPFYVLAPSSTVDMATATGADIPIEIRGADEVTHGFGRRTAPEGVEVYAPAFDVTPAALITAIVTEHGVLQGDLAAGLRDLLTA